MLSLCCGVGGGWDPVWGWLEAIIIFVICYCYIIFVMVVVDAKFGPWGGGWKPDLVFVMVLGDAKFGLWGVVGTQCGGWLGAIREGRKSLCSSSGARI